MTQACLVASVPYVTQKIICLGCGTQFYGTSNKCVNCDRDFYQKLGFAKPDIFIPIMNRGIAIRVMGSAHDDPEREAYDKKQKEMLEVLGYMVADVSNENVKQNYK